MKSVRGHTSTIPKIMYPYILCASVFMAIGAAGAVFLTAPAAGGLKEVRGEVTSVKDLYTLESGGQSGYYKQIRELKIGNQQFYLPIAGESTGSEAYRVKQQ